MMKLYLNSLLQGTHTFDSETFRKEILRLGASLQPFSESGVSGFYFSVLKDNVEPLFFLLADTLFSPRLNEEGLKFARKKMDVENPHIFSQSESAVKMILFKENLQNQAMSPQTLKNIHEKNIFAKNLNIVLTGDITSINAKNLVEKYFAKAKGQAAQEQEIISPVAPGLSQESFIFGNTPYQLSTLGLVLPGTYDFFYAPDISLHFLCSEVQAQIHELIDCAFERYPRSTLFLFNFAHEKNEKKIILKEFLTILKKIKQSELSSDTVLWLEEGSHLLLRTSTFADEARILARHQHYDLPLSTEKVIKSFSRNDIKLMVHDLAPEQYSLGTLQPLDN